MNASIGTITVVGTTASLPGQYTFVSIGTTTATAFIGTVWHWGTSSDSDKKNEPHKNIKGTAFGRMKVTEFKG